MLSGLRKLEGNRQNPSPPPPTPPTLPAPSERQAAAAELSKEGKRLMGLSSPASSRLPSPKAVMKIHSYTFIRGSIDVPAYNIGTGKWIIARKGADSSRISSSVVSNI